jgi:hypothetical protein
MEHHIRFKSNNQILRNQQLYIDVFTQHPPQNHDFYLEPYDSPVKKHAVQFANILIKGVTLNERLYAGIDFPWPRAALYFLSWLLDFKQIHHCRRRPRRRHHQHNQHYQLRNMTATLES